MCVKSLTCLCHHLEIAIKQDVTNELKEIFESCYIDELYNFLSDAYKLIETKSNDEFATHMNELVKNYLLETSPNSINVQHDRVRKDFMDFYDENIDDLASEKFVLNEKLILIVQDVQHLTYMNLSNIDSFKNCLEKIDKENNSPAEDNKSHKRRGCTIF